MRKQSIPGPLFEEERPGIEASLLVERHGIEASLLVERPGIEASLLVVIVVSSNRAV